MTDGCDSLSELISFDSIITELPTGSAKISILNPCSISFVDVSNVVVHSFSVVFSSSIRDETTENR